ncbi:hypothetical protein IGI04_042737, partial [Brassica rapa subsp. trilocularis]
AELQIDRSLQLRRTRRRATYQIEALDETNPIFDAPTLAETIHGADLVLGTLIRANKIFYPNSNLTTSASCSEQSQLTFTSQAARVPNQPARKGSNPRPDRRQRPSSSRLRFISPSWRSGFYNLQDKGNPNSENMSRTWLSCKD